MNPSHLRFFLSNGLLLGSLCVLCSAGCSSTDEPAAGSSGYSGASAAASGSGNPEGGEVATSGASGREDAGGAGSGGAAGSAGSGAAEAGSGGEWQEIAWGPCPDDFLDQCASVLLPLDDAEPEGEVLPIFVSRHLAQSGAAKAQVWLLAGGPGGSGNAFKGFVEQFFAKALPDVDFYVLEHRGVGESSRLGCPVEEAPASAGGINITADEWPACLEAVKAKWADKLASFRTTNDAGDLARLIERTREPNKGVFIYGVSYGTFRALRFLQTHPALVDGVILDSVAAPGVQFISQYDGQYDPVGQKIATLCAADATCGAKLGPDPWAKVTGLMTKLDAGHCRELGMNGQALRSISFLFPQLREFRAHFYPLIYRMDRCTADDVAVVAHYVTALSAHFQATAPTVANRDSAVLQWHVSLSELWETPPPSTSDLEGRCAGLVFCPGVGAGAAPLDPIWPRYAPDQYVNRWPTSKTPILSMNGELDPQTPIENAVITAQKLTAPHQEFVSVAFSPHIVAVESPVKTANAAPCGTQMMASFVRDPTATPDTSCLSDLVPLAFTEEPAVVQHFFGTSDMWENTSPTTRALALRTPAAIDWRGVVAAVRKRPLF